jgi:AraC-like DNA-binding protein
MRRTAANRRVSTVFKTMEGHGEKVRSSSASGMLILSILPPGLSLIQARSRSVKFVIQGEETYEVAGRTHRIRAGEFMLVEPNTELKVSIRGSEKTIGLCAYLPSGLGSHGSYEVDCAFSSTAILGFSADPLAGLLAKYGRRLAGEPWTGPGLADQVLREVTRASDDFFARFKGKLDRLGAQKTATRVETLHRLERARDFIHENAQRNVTLDEIGRHAMMSRFHVARSFTEVYGTAPLAYHRKLRLEAAVGRLKRGECSPTQMSDELGYSNLSAFTRAFVRTYGVPPSQAHRLI